MKIIILLIFSQVFVTTVFSQDPSTAKPPPPRAAIGAPSRDPLATNSYENFSKKIENVRKYGVRNKSTKEDVIPAIYDQIIMVHYYRNSMIYGQEYSDENPLFKVKLEDKYGIVNSRNEIVIPVEFDFVDHHYMKKDEKVGSLNTEGATPIPFIYSNLDFRKIADNQILAKKGKYWGIIDNNGKIVLPHKFTELKLFTKSNYKSIHNNYKSTNYAYFVAKNKKGQHGVLDANTFEKVLNFEYSNLEVIEQSFLVDGKSSTYPIFKVKKEGKEGVIGYHNQTHIPIAYQSVEIIGSNPNIVTHLKCKRAGKFGLIYQDNSILLDFNYDNLYYLQKDRLAIVVNNKFGLAAMNGQVLSEPQYDYISYFPKMIQEPVVETRVENDGKYGKINTEGVITTSIESKLGELYQNPNQLINDFIAILKSDEEDLLNAFMEKALISELDVVFLTGQKISIRYNTRGFEDDPQFMAKKQKFFTEKFTKFRSRLNDSGFVSDFEVVEIILDKKETQVYDISISTFDKVKVLLKCKGDEYKINIGRLIKIENNWKLLWDFDWKKS